MSAASFDWVDEDESSAMWITSFIVNMADWSMNTTTIEHVCRRTQNGRRGRSWWLARREELLCVMCVNQKGLGRHEV